MPKTRFTSAEKAKAVTRHLQDGVAISSICSELAIHPNLFYLWKKQLFEGAENVFDNKGQAELRQHNKKVAELEKRLQKKDTVIAELLEEYTALKKSLGFTRWMGRIGASGADCCFYREVA